MHKLIKTKKMLPKNEILIVNFFSHLFFERNYSPNFESTQSFKTKLKKYLYCANYNLNIPARKKNAVDKVEQMLLRAPQKR